jgi:enoyl-CoA hydratase/carnithine racemase
VIELEKTGDVFLLRMIEGENRFNRAFLEAHNSALDEVEASEGPAALVTTGAGKFYSNGLDLDWLTERSAAEVESFVSDVESWFARILAFPMVTVGALNGHCFAGGAMLSLAHDFRIMRNDRGYWCLPEIDLGIPFRPGMTALIQSHIPKPTFHEALVTGKRFDAEEAEACGIVDATADESDVIARAVEIAAANAGKRRDTMAEIKRGMYEGALRLLER